MSINPQIETQISETSLTLPPSQAIWQPLEHCETMAALGSLVAGMTHEISTPIGVGITAISHLRTKMETFLTLYQSNQMKRSDLEKFLKSLSETLPLALSNLERAAQLVNSFKQVAIDQQNDERRIFNMRELLDNVLLTLRPKLKRTSHQMEIDGDSGLMLNSYPGVFAQVITHLVNNSLTHGYDTSEVGRLTFRFFSDTQHLKFEYSDQGKGIPADLLNKILSSFVTSLTPCEQRPGLAVVHYLVTQRLKGVVHIESAINQGTKFIIEVPNFNG